MNDLRGGVRAWSLAALALSAGCASRAAPGPATQSLGGDAARVGDTPVSVALVVAVARAEGAAPRDALGRVVEDLLLAKGAQREGLDRDPAVDWACTTVLSQFAPAKAYEASRERGAPSDDELATVKVIHAVVLRSPGLSRGRAQAMAETVRQVASVARSDVDFEQRIKALPHPDVSLRVERLPEFDAGGRTSGGEGLDPTFTAAAFALRRPGETSGVVESPFGWHVIRLVERRLPDRERREALGVELGAAVVDVRAQIELDSLLGELRRRSSVDVATGADELMARAFAGETASEP